MAYKCVNLSKILKWTRSNLSLSIDVTRSTLRKLKNRWQLVTAKFNYIDSITTGNKNIGSFNLAYRILQILFLSFDINRFFIYLKEHLIIEIFFIFINIFYY